jgi:hypothetical protein
LGAGFSFALLNVLSRQAQGITIEIKSMAAFVGVLFVGMLLILCGIGQPKLPAAPSTWLIIALIGGVLGPLLLIWIIALYFQRDRVFLQHASRLGNVLEALAYPTDGAEQRIEAVTNSLKAQARMLTQATESTFGHIRQIEAACRTEMTALQAVTDQLRVDADQLKMSLQAETSSLAEVLVRITAEGDMARQQMEAQTRALNEAATATARRTQEASAHLTSQVAVTLGEGERAAARIEGLVESLSQQTAAVERAGDFARTRANALAASIASADDTCMPAERSERTKRVSVRSNMAAYRTPASGLA